MTNSVWEQGVQNERTRLAWQRTTLSALVCSLAVARLLLPISAALMIMVALAALAAAFAMAWLGRRRYARHHEALHNGSPLSDARPQLAVCVLVAVTGFGALLYALLS